MTNTIKILVGVGVVGGVYLLYRSTRPGGALAPKRAPATVTGGSFVTGLASLVGGVAAAFSSPSSGPNSYGPGAGGGGATPIFTSTQGTFTTSGGTTAPGNFGLTTTGPSNYSTAGLGTSSFDAYAPGASAPGPYAPTDPVSTDGLLAPEYA